jgi:hypothetical protein
VGDLHALTTGPVSPAVATIFAALGGLLSILLLTRARRHTGWRRVRLVTYAIPALALPAVVLPALMTVLALRVDGSVLLLAPIPLGYGLATAVGGTTLASVTLCFGRPGFARQVLAGILLVGTVGGTGFFLATSLTTGLPIDVRLGPTGVALGLACVTGFGLATALAATRTLRRAVGTATLLGLSLAVTYHVAAFGLTLRPTPDGPVPARDLVGLEPQQVGLPAIAVIAAIVTFIWYFTLGTATMRDLRRTFEPDADVEEIEPWMVEQVRRRVAHTATVAEGIPAWPDDWDPTEPAVALHAVAIVGRDAARAVDHHSRAALPAGAGQTPPVAELTGAHATADGPAQDGSAESGRLDMAGRASDTDANTWPAGRNELAAARAAGAWSSNNRFGSSLSGDFDGTDPFRTDPFKDVDQQAWAERLSAAREAVAAAHSSAPAIVHEHRPGSTLPRRNTAPLHRP